MIHLDVTMTAVRRPEIWRRTLESFSKMFDQERLRFIVNVDPVGDDVEVETMSSEIARRVIVNYAYPDLRVQFSKLPGLGRAFKWCWENTEADWVFHLEDDWELISNRPRIMDMWQCMVQYPNLAALRLSMFTAGRFPHSMDSWGKLVDEPMKNWNRWIPYNRAQGFYEIKAEERHRIGVCGHPTLFRGDFVRAVTPLLDPDRNPEKQFQGSNPAVTAEMMNWRFGVWAQPGDPPAIRDIGRDWIANSGWQKKGEKAFFTEWEKVDRKPDVVHIVNPCKPSWPCNEGKPCSVCGYPGKERTEP